MYHILRNWNIHFSLYIASKPNNLIIPLAVGSTFVHSQMSPTELALYEQIYNVDSYTGLVDYALFVQRDEH